MSISEEKIIRRKLLVEGDGGNEDKKITNLLKSFLKFVDAPQGPETEEHYKKTLMQLTLLENSMKKNVLVHKMNEKEQENYNLLNDDFESSIEEAHKKIVECKSELMDAKRIRKNRLEYDAVAKVIQQHPDRRQSLGQLSELQLELQKQKQSEKQLDDKLQLRRKQFHVLLSAIHDMQRILDEDDRYSDEVAEETDMDTA